jgi:plasmanylethanolamine desaturase
MNIILQVIGIIMAADFITGFVHWLEDSYWSPDTPILGKWIVVDNLAHHKNGQDFLKKSYWESCWDTVLAGVIALIVALILHKMSWQLLFFTVILMNANQIHKWAHITRFENKPKVIGLLQKMHVLQSTQHHGQHHRKPNNSHYCTVTDFLNPVLDYMHFWRGLEWIFGSKNSPLATKVD